MTVVIEGRLAGEVFVDFQYSPIYRMQLRGSSAGFSLIQSDGSFWLSRCRVELEKSQFSIRGQLDQQLHTEAAAIHKASSSFANEPREMAQSKVRAGLIMGLAGQG